MNIVKLSNLFKQITSAVGLNGYRFGYASELNVQTLTATDFPIMYAQPFDEFFDGATVTAKGDLIIEDTVGYSGTQVDTRTRAEVWRDLQTYARRFLCALEQIDIDCLTVISNGFNLEYNHRTGSHKTCFIIIKLEIGYRPDVDTWTFDPNLINLAEYDERDPLNQ